MEVFKEVLKEATCVGLGIGKYLYTEPVDVKVYHRGPGLPIGVTMKVFRSFFTNSDGIARYGDIFPWFKPEHFEDAAKFHGLELKRTFPDKTFPDGVLEELITCKGERVTLDIKTFPGTVMHRLTIQGDRDTSLSISYFYSISSPLSTRIFIFLKGRNVSHLRQEYREWYSETDQIEGGSILHQFITQLK